MSAQHKILVSGWRAELLFGKDEILVAATHLVNADTIHRAPRRYVDYHHLMFDRHEVLLTEGVPAESFYPGEYILRDDALREKVADLFPEMIEQDVSGWKAARTMLGGRETKVLCGYISGVV